MRKIVAAGLAVTLGFLMTPGVGAQADEGIKVHGHWKIEIVDPDGTLVSVHEFENALSNTGGEILALTVGSELSIGTMFVWLESPTVGNGPCDDGSGGQSACVIIEAGSYWSPANDIFHSTNLTTVVALLSVSFSGSVTAAYSTTVGEVGTSIKACPSDVSADACLAYTGTAVERGFSSTILSPIVGVQAGQIIQVTVTFTFS